MSQAMYQYSTYSNPWTVIHQIRMSKLFSTHKQSMHYNLCITKPYTENPLGFYSTSSTKLNEKRRGKLTSDISRVQYKISESILLHFLSMMILVTIPARKARRSFQGLCPVRLRHSLSMQQTVTMHSSSASVCWKYTWDI